MRRIANSLFDFIDKIGKHNFILIIFIFIVFMITGLYTTFSLYTSFEGTEIINGLTTYNFILNPDNTSNSVIIPANSERNISITLYNDDEIKMNYGIYYNSNNDLTDVNIRKSLTSDYPVTGVIDVNSSYAITINVKNNATTPVAINFGVTFGFVNGGDLILPEGSKFIDGSFYLSDVEAGSYVYYRGTNGCTDATCTGNNANYLNDSNMGYCENTNAKFNVNGWRVAYVEEKNAYLISAGATDCVCTNNDGTVNSVCDTNDTTNGAYLHLTNLDNIALKYCNPLYAKDGICDTTTSWAMDDSDFKKITQNDLATCIKEFSYECQTKNNLIDNGSYYWFNSPIDEELDLLFNWNPFSNVESINNSSKSYGVRPILQMDSNIVVVGGSGTYNNPYRIATKINAIDDLSNNANGGINNGATIDKENGTITTDGISNYIDAGLINYNFKDSITYAVNFKINSLNQDLTEQAIIGTWEDAGSGISILNNRITFSLNIEGVWKRYITDVTPAIDEWYTIVATYDGKNMNLYINGSKANLDTTIQGNIPSNSITGNITPSSSFIAIGAKSQKNTNIATDMYLNATFKSVVLYDRALTEKEINNGFIGKINPINKKEMLLYYEF